MIYLYLYIAIAVLAFIVQALDIDPRTGDPPYWVSLVWAANCAIFWLPLLIWSGISYLIWGRAE